MTWPGSGGPRSPQCITSCTVSGRSDVYLLPGTVQHGSCGPDCEAWYGRPSTSTHTGWAKRIDAGAVESLKRLQCIIAVRFHPITNIDLLIYRLIDFPQTSWNGGTA